MVPAQLLPKTLCKVVCSEGFSALTANIVFQTFGTAGCASASLGSRHLAPSRGRAPRGCVGD